MGKMRSSALPPATTPSSNTTASSVDNNTNLSARARHAKQKIAEFFNWFLYHFHIIWLTTCQWIITLFSRRAMAAAMRGDLRRFAKRRMQHPAFSLQRRLVLIGDDIADGVGDGVTLASVQPAGLLRTMPRPLPGLFFGWHYFTYAMRGSETSDWLPSTDEPSSFVGLPWRHVPLFERVFNEKLGLYPDSDVVVLCCGFADRCTPETTAKNIVRICVALEERGKFVVVVPPFITDKVQSIGGVPLLRYKKRIELITESILRVWPNQDSATNKVRLGRDMSETMKYAKQWRFGGRFPGSRAYKAWTQAYRDPFFAACKAVEAPLYVRLLNRTSMPTAKPTAT
jgi:hypothetical protein